MIDTQASSHFVPLGFQRQVLFHLERYGNDHSFNVPLLLGFPDRVADDAFTAGVTRIAKRFPELHARLQWVADQWVLSRGEAACPIEVHDVGDDPTALNFLIKVQASAVFDLLRGPLIRFTLLHHEGRSSVLIVAHHLVVDGYALDMLSEVMSAALDGKPIDRWTSWFERPDAARVNGDPDENAPPFKAGSRGESALHYFTLASGRTLSDLAVRHRVTVSELVLALCARALASWTHDSELRLGMPVANRHTMDELVSLGCNTWVVPLKLQTAPGLSLESLLERVRTAVRRACEVGVSEATAYETLYSYREFAASAQSAGRCTVLSENRLFEAYGLKVPCKLPLSFLVERCFDRRQPETEEIRLGIEYELSRHSTEAIHDLVHRLQFYVQEAMRLPGQDIPWPSLSTPAAQVPTRPVQAAYPSIRHFSAQLGVRRLDCDQVAGAVLRLKQQLKTLGIRTLVIESGKSAETICLIYACFELGICYVPLDAALPFERRQFIYVETGADAVAVDAEGAVRLEPLSPVSERRIPEGIQYVIYTSGSTGRPKGVMVSRKRLDQLISSMVETLALPEGSSVLSYANLFFDMSVPDVYLPYRLQGELSLVDNVLKMRPGELMAAINAVAPTVLQMTPTALSVFSDNELKTLRAGNLILGGEAVSTRYVPSRFPTVGKLWNFYGPTEAVVWCACALITEGAAVDVAQALPGYVVELRHEARPCLPYDCGEIYIGGNIASGYVDPAQGVGKFFAFETSTSPTEWYASGDAGVFIPGQGIRVLGRLDSQVKVNGLRIELGDIDASLERVDGVQQALAYFSPQDGVLCALLVLSGAVNVDAVRAASAKLLPTGMLPTDWHVVSTLPTSTNGKKQRNHEAIKRHLTDPPVAGLMRNCADAVKVPVEPSALSVGKSNRLYQELERHLGPLAPRLQQSFLAAGGNSLKAIAIVRALKSAQISINVGLLLEQPTLQDLIHTVNSAD